MKKEFLYGGLLTIFMSTFLITGCLNEDNKIPPNCYDGILNNDEFLLDCGGPNCPACDHCIDGVWQPELGETWRDCGGECGECPSCGNGVQDGDETGIDCGGSCNIACLDLCGDGLWNGNEDEVDCGGACEPCPTCTDLTMNGAELGVDCGGMDCPPCATDGNCGNGYMDGDELWIDCGTGDVGYCPYCDTIFTWKIGGTTYTCSPEDIDFNFDGTDLLVVGTSLQGGTFSLLIAEPAAGWQDEVEGLFTPTTAPGTLIATTMPDGTQYSSGFGSSNGDFTIQRFVDGPGGIMRIIFNGIMFKDDASGSVNAQNGLLMYPVD